MEINIIQEPNLLYFVSKCSSLGLHVTKYVTKTKFKVAYMLLCAKFRLYFSIFTGLGRSFIGIRLVVALWNRCSKVATITASWEALGLESGIHVSVRDLWQVS